MLLEVVLEQCLTKHSDWAPLAFFSRMMSNTEQRYAAFDRELLAIFLSVKQFRHLLEGRQFTIFTDHRPITGAINRKTNALSTRQERQLAFISEFTSDIQHISGLSNVVADALSRTMLAATSMVQPLLEDIIDAQQTDAETQRIINHMASDSTFRFARLEHATREVLCCNKFGRLRPFVPAVPTRPPAETAS